MWTITPPSDRILRRRIRSWNFIVSHHTHQRVRGPTVLVWWRCINYYVNFASTKRTAPGIHPPCQFWSISDEVNHPRWLSGDVVLWFSHPWCWRRRCVWWAHTAPTSPMRIMQRSWFLAAALVGVRAPGFTQTSGCPTQSKSQGPGTFEADDFWYQFMIIDPGILA